MTQYLFENPHTTFLLLGIVGFILVVIPMLALAGEVPYAPSVLSRKYTWLHTYSQFAGMVGIGCLILAMIGFALIITYPAEGMALR
jgi:preprotein translocase subunit Sss1